MSSKDLVQHPAAKLGGRVDLLYILKKLTQDKQE